MLRESEGRRWVEEAAQKSICVTEGRDCPESGWYMYLSTWLIHYCSVCNLWVAFPLHSELVQLFSIRLSLIPLYSPPAPHMCANECTSHPSWFVSLALIANPTVHNWGPCNQENWDPLLGVSFGKEIPQALRAKKSNQPFCGYIPAESQCHKIA